MHWLKLTVYRGPSAKPQTPCRDFCSGKLLLPQVLCNSTSIEVLCLWKLVAHSQGCSVRWMLLNQSHQQPLRHVFV